MAIRTALGADAPVAPPRPRARLEIAPDAPVNCAPVGACTDTKDPVAARAAGPTVTVATPARGSTTVLACTDCRFGCRTRFAAESGRTFTTFAASAFARERALTVAGTAGAAIAGRLEEAIAVAALTTATTRTRPRRREATWYPLDHAPASARNAATTSNQ